MVLNRKSLAAGVGKLIARKLFEKRSKGRGYRHVEAHLGEDEVAELVAIGIEAAFREADAFERGGAGGQTLDEEEERHG